MAGQRSNHTTSHHRKPKVKQPGGLHATRKNFVKSNDSNNLLEAQQLNDLLNEAAINIDHSAIHNDNNKLKVKSQKRSPPKNIITNPTAIRLLDTSNATNFQTSDDDDWKSLPSSAASSFTGDPFQFSKFSMQTSATSSPTPSLVRPSLLSSLLRNNPIPPMPVAKTPSSVEPPAAEYGISETILTELSDSLRTSLIHDHQFNGLIHRPHGHQAEWRSKTMSQSH